MLGENSVNERVISNLIERTLLAAERRSPESTYRLQFHSGFTFRDAREVAAYLRDLGITHCYASPYLKARPGSTHGYDITDHSVLNPELGTDADYREWVDELHRLGLGQILDVVPNHMAVATSDNIWWNDVLENGPASRYAGYFDIAWGASPRPELQDKVLLPFLSAPYGEVLEAGDIRLIFENGAFAFSYFDLRFPAAPDTYDSILMHRLEELERILGPDDPALLEYQSIMTAVRNLPGRSETDLAKIAERSREKEIIKRRLAVLTESVPAIQQFLSESITGFNGRPGDASSFDRIDQLLERQCFRLSYWRVAPDEINYRRFFDVNDLAALSTEREEVARDSGSLVMLLLVGRSVDGLRIDHPDGLYDPAQYFRRLHESFLMATARSLIETDGEFRDLSWEEIQQDLRVRFASPGSRPLYVVAEKILEPPETLPRDWPIAGSSGYDFINAVNGLFVDSSNEEAFSQLYSNFSGNGARFADVVYRSKRLILEVLLASELHMLTHQLDRLAQKSRHSRDFTFNTLRHALREVIAAFPVYRSYIAEGAVPDEDRRCIQTAVRRAAARNPLGSPQVFRFIRSMLLLESPHGFDDEGRAEQRRFTGKFQQVTSPVAAKGVEDTAFYIYNRLMSLNEVGGNPGRFGIPPDAVHALFRERQQQWPLGLSPLSTHDTKRSEDVRARLNVLSEIPEAWQVRVQRWAEMNAIHRQTVEDLVVPDSNEEYLFYQTLVGVWPLEALDDAGHSQCVQRIQAYMEKALHEAKVHTSWINPNTEYDRAVSSFVGRVLDPSGNHQFWDDFDGFRRRIADLGLFNSLSQTVLRITAPGVPDTYQGTEMWDFSLVDPDNRRPVDYAARRRTLHELQSALSSFGDLRRLVRELLNSREDGRIKMYVTFRALHCRRDNPGLFSSGTYIPLKTRGEKAEHLFCFARVAPDWSALVAVPRLITRLMSDTREPPLGRRAWGTTAILTEGLPGRIQWQDVFTGAGIQEQATEGAGALHAADIFANLPVAVLIGRHS